jgi:hypothetical protein
MLEGRRHQMQVFSASNARPLERLRVAQSVERIDEVAAVRNEITGDSGAAQKVTYMINQGEQQDTYVALPWSKEFTADQGFQTFVVNAQNSGSGSISCTNRG